MALNDGPTRLTATAVFNPTASSPGFLVPLFPGQDGDNQTYVQRYGRPERLLEFTAVSWPDEGATEISAPLAATVGDESLWGFAFPDEEPLVLPWRLFRAEMTKRLQDPCFDGKPGLLFDVVEGLDIEEAKERVYLAAFEAYAKHGSRVAEQWRDRSILEPVLQEAIAQHLPGGQTQQPRLLMANLVEGQLSIELRHERTERIRGEIASAYEHLAKRHPKLFPRQVVIAISEGLTPPLATSPSSRTTVVAVHGRLAERELARGHWRERGIEIVDADQLQDLPTAIGERRQVVYVSALGDWNDRSPRAVEADHAVAILMTTAMSPLVREGDMRVESSMPTIVAFSPYGTSRFGGDPLTMVSRLIATLAECWQKGERLPAAPHSSLIRESKPISSDLAGTACSLVGRALRVQAPIDAPAHLVLDDRMPERMQAALSEALSSAMNIAKTHLIGSRAVRGRPIPMLLVQRPTEFGYGQGRDNLREGVRRILEIRGWHTAEGEQGLLRARDHTHNFSVMVARHNNELPNEPPPPDRPGFGRAPMLVVHESPRREWLLAGNLGANFHVGLEDLALMLPGTQWVWPILRRQLRGQAKRGSTNTLRLFTALAVEALTAGRYQESIVKFDPDKAVRMLSGPDRLEHTRLSSEDAPEDGAQLILSGMHDEVESYLRLHIQDEGPFVEIM